MRSLTAAVVSTALLLIAAGCGTKPEKKAAAPEPQAPAEKSAAPAKLPAKPGFTVTASGLQYKDLKVGKGQAAKPGDAVSVHYKGWLDDGTVFDTSKKPGGGPFSFGLGRGEVIEGWDEGVQGIKPGGIRELIIPANLGYGESGSGQIPPNATLHFKVELLKIGG